MARTSRVEAMMTKYLTGVLTVIAVGVLLIAYGLLNSGATGDASSAVAPAMASVPTSEPVAMRIPVSGGYGYAYVPAGVYVPAGATGGFAAQSAPAVSYAVPSYVQPGYAQPPYAQPGYAQTDSAQPVSMTGTAPRAVRTVSYEPAASRRATTDRVVERKPQRDWKRTALIIGGASAAGAGVGAMVGGRKGALIGAAVGGGAGTIYQTTR
jgi:hypothetical protein